MSIESTLAEIEEAAVDEVEVASFGNERQHYGVAFSLFRETAGCVCILASTTVGLLPVSWTPA